MVKKTTKQNPIILELESKVADLELSYRRVLADFQNQERRHKEQESNLIKMSSSSVLEKMLSVLDSLQLAQSHLKDTGLKIVIDQFTKTLESEGLTKINTDNTPFDPITMDCLETVEGPKDQVVETVSEGYFLFDKVLRPAKVKVGLGEK